MNCLAVYQSVFWPNKTITASKTSTIDSFGLLNDFNSTILFLSSFARASFDASSSG